MVPCFSNHGNTCWLNALAQLLRAMGQQHSLPAAVREFMAGGGTRQQAQAVARLLGLRFGMQHDAHEALVQVIDRAAPELRNALTLRTRTVREAPGQRAVEDAVDYVMLREIADVSVQGMLDGLGVKRTVFAQLGRHTRFQETTMVRLPLPRLLLIMLKRFGYPSVKLRDAVKAGEVVSLAGAMYRLAAIIVHLGATPQSGHYVAHVREAAGWVRYDDASAMPSAGPRAQEVQHDGYVLLYARC